MSNSGHVAANNLFFSFRTPNHETVVFKDFSMEIKPKEILALVGPSGCGKSTFLNLIAGFLHPDQGTLLIDGEPVNFPGPDRGVVFQNQNLFPWKTVQGNVEFGLRMRGYQESERERIAKEAITDVGLSGFENSYPIQLSGGMAQRVGFARLIVNNPRVMLLDEPFGSLDAVTRSQMRNFFLEIWQRHKGTVLFITHDLDEALLFGDRVVLLSRLPANIVEEIKIEAPRPSQEELLEREDLRKARKTLSNLLYGSC